MNTPEQTVISGATAAVERAIALAKERGARRAVLLQVSAPFHCSLMQPAQDALAPVLESLPFSSAKVPVVVNVDATLVTDRKRCATHWFAKSPARFVGRSRCSCSSPRE